MALATHLSPNYGLQTWQIDFVEIASAAQTALRVHFLNAVPLQGTLSAIPRIDGGETIRSVAMSISTKNSARLPVSMFSITKAASGMIRLAAVSGLATKSVNGLSR
jgi:hypothetical protein